MRLAFRTFAGALLVPLLTPLLTLWAAIAAAAPLQPLRLGYAFDQPRILAQQQLFGRAHGIALLAAACGEKAQTQAFVAWNAQQAAAIGSSLHDLARYYFGERAIEASRLDIVRALRLQEKLVLRSGSKELNAACATFAEALTKPRYDLREQFHLQALVSRLEAATRTEAEAEACYALLDNDGRAMLNEAMALWRATYAAGSAEAASTLEKRGSELPLDGSLEQWLALARVSGRKAADSERCKTLPARLLTRKLDPDHDFAPAP